MIRNKVDLKDLLAKARAIHFAMTLGAIPYEQAKQRCEPLLNRINNFTIRKAKKHGVKPKLIMFQDLGRSL